jgi:mono/diheme cytochrome c family protein
MCAALAVSIAGACGGAALAAPAAESAEQARAATIQRGEYVARAADCFSCHTAPGGKLFAGGAALKTPFGELYPPNITPDKSTGIGTWSEEDFERALRLGVRKDGALLYPAMPYTNYAHMSRDDLQALWVFMTAVPAVTQQPPKNTLSFPFNIRAGLAVWQSLYFKPKPFALNPAKGEAWNRGHYLVEALGHCDACHTPRNVAQATESQHQLTGAQIEGWYAPDIGSDPLSATSKWKVEDLAHFLKTGQAPGNVKVYGPMQEVVHDSLSHLSDSDLLAIATYLKDPLKANPQQGSAGTLSSSADIRQGRAIYLNDCASCHGSNGRGKPGVVPALAGDGTLTAREPYNVIMVLLQGLDARGTWGAMGSFATSLDDQQIADVTNYVRTAWGNGGEPNATAATVGNWRQITQPPANGEPAAMICPVLDDDELKPALDVGAQALRQSAGDPSRLELVVNRYVHARPQSSSAQIIEALSTAYCRAVTADRGSAAQHTAMIADYSQQLAVVLTQRHGGDRSPKASGT